MQNWIGMIFGTLTVRVTGGSHERFMNLCAVYNRDMWDFRAEGDSITVKVRASEYKNLRKAAHRAGVRLKIIKRHGIPFWLRRYKNRYGLVAGILVFCLLLSFFSSRIWVIRMRGVEGEIEQQILTQMKQEGITLGTRTSAFDFATVRQKLIVACPQISWMSLNPSGSVLNVDVSLRTAPPLVLDHQQPCNLIASVDGTILSMNIKNGDPMVKVGDGVVKGDLLVSGAVEYADGCTVFRKAEGEILAETKHRVTFQVPYEQTHSCYTGKTKRRYAFHFFGLSLPLYIGSVSGTYEKTDRYRPLVIDQVALPIGIYESKFALTQPLTVHLSREEAVAEATEKTMEYVSQSLPNCEITAINYQKEFTSTHALVTAEILCKENIAFAEKMLIFQ